MTKRRTIAAALAIGLAAAAAIYIPYAYAAGSFSQWPVVGSAAITSGTITIPAGPTALTGAEVIPADTNLSAGAPPQTVNIPVILLQGAPWAFETHPTTASSVTITNNVGGLFVTTLAAAKINLGILLPSSPIDNQRFMLATDRSITQIFFTPNTGQSVNGGSGLGSASTGGVTLSATAATTTAGATGLTLVYRLSNTTWYRIQ